MKRIIFILCWLVASLGSSAQNPLSTKPRLFFAAGFVTPQFYGGTELLRANELRQEEVSYFQNEQDIRATVGSYPINTGFSLSIGYYLPFPKLIALYQ